MNCTKGLISGVLVSVMLAVGNAAAVQGPSLQVTVGCTPDSFRPQEATAVHCTITVSNLGDVTAEDVTLTLESAPDLSVPDVYFVQRVEEGQATPISPSALSFSIGDLPAESSRSGETVAILWTSAEGRYGGTLTVRDAAGLTGGQTQVAFTVSAEAVAPPKDLLLASSLREAGSPQPVPSATYDFVFTNAGDQEITSLVLLDKLPPGLTLKASQPPAQGDAALGEVRWDLGAFGRSSLPPGESLTASLTLTPIPPVECALARNGIVAFAAPTEGGTEVYAALSEPATVGPCTPLGAGGGGASAIPGITELPRGGSGGYLSVDGSPPRPFLAGGFAAGLFLLAGTGLALRLRLHGRRRYW